MSDTVIKVEEVGKLYRLGEIGTGTLSHDLNRWWARVRGKEDPFAKVGEVNDRTSKGSSEYVWALKDVSFEVKQGEVLGIIGRNGAGKSTLLKILSKVTTPSHGRIKLKGRIASLLEVGTGFHPELTGRENIFLNGAILGMTKAEIKSKFDEIVDFAGVERYIDTPVKRYSSGMYVRLAFAVAAFLEPEILIVDEVLAVGDAEFQKKCLGRMKDVSKNDGRTILFVSHNMGAIRSLCNRGFYLKNGTGIAQGEVSDIIELYLQSGLGNESSRNFESYLGRRRGNGAIKFTSAEILDVKGNPKAEFFIGETLQLRFEIRNFSSLKTSHVGVTIKTAEEIPIMFIVNKDSNYIIHHKKINETYCIILDDLSFYPGRYTITLTIADGISQEYDYVENCLSFNVLEGGPKVNRSLPKETGLIFVAPTWKQLA